MVAEGDKVDICRKTGRTRFFGNSVYLGGVFAVRRHEVNVVLFSYFRQLFPHVVDAARADHIPYCKNLHYLTGVPVGTLSSTKISLQPQALLVAAISMPLLVTPVSLAGFRFAKTIIFLPISSSGV